MFRRLSVLSLVLGVVICWPGLAESGQVADTGSTASALCSALAGVLVRETTLTEVAQVADREEIYLYFSRWRAGLRDASVSSCACLPGAGTGSSKAHDASEEMHFVKSYGDARRMALRKRDDAVEKRSNSSECTDLGISFGISN